LSTRVLKRGGPDNGVTLEDIDDFIEYLCSRSKLVQIYFRWMPALRDPDDDRILKVAVRTQSAVVTFNAKDFVEAGRFGIRIMSPRQMLTLVEGLK
jgi:predicted nucleic acid-binding protein